MPEAAARARRIIDSNQYLTLATADADGRPWASPVWFAHQDHKRFIWVSKPDARHSRNLAERPEIALVVFDSTLAIGTGDALYAEAAAEQLDGPDVAGAIEVFSRRSLECGGRAWTADEVGRDALHRLYRATASALFILGENDERIPVDLA
ncbi:MAG TPA: pyridoxamine 5'-phosphate oxidase family protein [Thermoleophilaceae bacterium]|nr:pyridoxamine 5'-phosphate oxidase family protein [Thermoleophilaceae bacterium]